ncbi:MAG: 30S ribosomal protein S6 [Bdellovibrionales bacterium]|nr:30S ribosomal protein S6 [Bdellovibrionales bacterium]
MKKYELIVVFSGQLGESQVKEKVEKLRTMLEKNGAKEIVLDTWGKRSIAFEMNQSNHGTYQVFYYETEDGGIVDILNAALRIEEGVVKFQTHRIQEHVRKFRGRVEKEGSQVSA